jgi:hypothetical protein
MIFFSVMRRCNPVLVGGLLVHLRSYYVHIAWHVSLRHQSTRSSVRVIPRAVAWGYKPLVTPSVSEWEAF